MSGEEDVLVPVTTIVSVVTDVLDRLYLARVIEAARHNGIEPLVIEFPAERYGDVVDLLLGGAVDRDIRGAVSHFEGVPIAWREGRSIAIVIARETEERRWRTT